MQLQITGYLKNELTCACTTSAVIGELNVLVQRPDDVSVNFLTCVHKSSVQIRIELVSGSDHTCTSLFSVGIIRLTANNIRQAGIAPKFVKRFGKSLARDPAPIFGDYRSQLNGLLLVGDRVPYTTLGTKRISNEN